MTQSIVPGSLLKDGAGLQWMSVTGWRSWPGVFNTLSKLGKCGSMGKYSLIHTCTKIYFIPFRGIFPLLWCEVSFSALPLKVFTLLVSVHPFTHIHKLAAGTTVPPAHQEQPLTHIAAQITTVPLWKQFGVRYLTQGPFNIQGIEPQTLQSRDDCSRSFSLSLSFQAKQ